MRSTLNLTFRVVKMALEYCVDAEYISRNPMQRMKSPRVEQGAERVLSMEEIKAILNEAHGTRWYVAFWILGLTGMRISELLGLEWRNVDLTAGRLTVQRQIGRSYGEPSFRLLPLKSAAARRTIKCGVNFPDRFGSPISTQVPSSTSHALAFSFLILAEMGDAERETREEPPTPTGIGGLR